MASIFCMLIFGGDINSAAAYAAVFTEVAAYFSIMPQLGIGTALFSMARDWAREHGAGKLYISAHSAREPMAAYRALGCVEAEEIDPRHAAAEPCDVQLERLL